MPYGYPYNRYNVLGGGGGGSQLAGAFGFGGMPGMPGAGGGGMGGPSAVQAAAATPRSAVQPMQPGQPNAQFSMPPAQQYQAGGGSVQGVPELLGAGKGLLQPGSDYYQRLSEAMQQQIGAQSAAAQRASALRGAWSGFGAGAAPETMATSADIGRAGLEASGQAQANLALQAPQLGMQALQSTFSPQISMRQLGEQSRQFGAGLGEQARQFGVGAGLQQQQLAAQQAWQQAQLQQQAQLAQQQQAMQQQQMLMSLMAGMFGGY